MIINKVISTLYSIHLEKHDHFLYPFKRIQDSQYLRDMHDGKALTDLMSPGNFLSIPQSTGLVLSTDGVPIFKSSKGSLWPIYLMLTSIPPQLRNKVENLVVASLWFGPTKPSMNCMLQPILQSISHLEKGIVVQQTSSSQPITLRAKLVMGIFDLPARAAATNTKQFNGEYGCFYCVDKGEMHNRARIYPPNDKHDIRSHEQMMKWANEAEREQIAKYGVKGFSVLSNHLKFPACIPIDYMHSILEGVFKQLMKLWFGSSFHSKPFSLRKHVRTIEKIVHKVKPPKEIQRPPRSLEQMSFYKASEYRAWILFYALPIFSLFLPSEYSHHLSMLVSAVHILLSDKIMINDLNIAYKMLSTFYQTAGELYLPSIYTANMHSLEHLVSVVQLWGPLWAYSMFGFENLNGYLGSTYHGTRKIVYQMAFQIQMSQTIPDKLRELSIKESAEAQVYINKILSKNSTSMKKIDNNCYAMGKFSRYTLTPEESELASTNGISICGDVYIFQRLMFSNTIYHCKQYNRKGHARDNTICSYYLSDTQNIEYGEIVNFYVAEYPFCIINTFPVVKSSSPLTNVRPCRNKKISDVTSGNHISTIFNLIDDNNRQLIAIPLTNIVKKCIYINIPLQGQRKSYVIALPNNYEFH